MKQVVEIILTNTFLQLFLNFQLHNNIKTLHNSLLSLLTTSIMILYVKNDNTELCMCNTNLPLLQVTKSNRKITQIKIQKKLQNC